MRDRVAGAQPHKLKALIVFVRKPELGKVKTRLARSVGEETALQVYKNLINHSAAVVGEVVETFTQFKNEAVKVFVFYAAGIVQNDVWEKCLGERNLVKCDQVAGNLGEKMQAAFQHCFKKGAEEVVIIGSDCPEIQKNHILDAFETLNFKDIVFGPAEDGGYYLLGMKSLCEPLFELESWSTDSLLKESKAVLDSKMLTYKDLETLSDLDYEEDLLRFPSFDPRNKA